MNTYNIVKVFAESVGDRDELELNQEGFASQVYLSNKYAYKIRSFEGPRIPDSLTKERLVLDFLGGTKDSALVSKIPKFITENVLELDEKKFHITVQSRICGNSPKEIGFSQFTQIIQFLNQLHSTPIEVDGLYEFENETPINFKDYLKDKSRAFESKIQKHVNDEDDLRLLCTSTRLIDSLREEIDEVSYVLVHKDIYLPNLLFENGLLSGVVDWDSAQSAPREWEFAIIRQRFSNLWLKLQKNNNTRIQLDEKLLDACSLIQSLRFWKSFPSDSAFVNIQRQELRKIIKGY